MGFLCCGLDVFKVAAWCDLQSNEHVRDTGTELRHATESNLLPVIAGAMVIAMHTGKEEDCGDANFVEAHVVRSATTRHVVLQHIEFQIKAAVDEKLLRVVQRWTECGRRRCTCNGNFATFDAADHI